MSENPYEKKLLERMKNKGAKPKNASPTRSKLHDLGKHGETTSTIFRMIEVAPYELLTEVLVHRYLKIIGKEKESFYPTSKDLSVVCCGSLLDNADASVCPVCSDVRDVYIAAKKAEAAGKDGHAAFLRKRAGQTKGKRWTFWLAITRGGGPNGEDVIEPYGLQSWFFNESMLDLLTCERKAMHHAKWAILKKAELANMSDEDKINHWLANCPNKLALPSDMEHGWDICITKSGGDGGLTYKATFIEETPIVEGTADYALLQKYLAEKNMPSLDPFVKVSSAEDVRKLVGRSFLDLAGSAPVEVPDEEDAEEAPAEEDVADSSEVMSDGNSAASADDIPF